MSNVLLIAELIINRGNREVKIYRSEELFLKAFTELSLHSIRDREFCFELKRISEYIDGKLYPMYIELGNKGIKLKYKPTEGEER